MGSWYYPSTLARAVPRSLARRKRHHYRRDGTWQDDRYLGRSPGAPVTSPSCVPSCSASSCAAAPLISTPYPNASPHSQASRSSSRAPAILSFEPISNTVGLYEDGAVDQLVEIAVDRVGHAFDGVLVGDVQTNRCHVRDWLKRLNFHSGICPRDHAIARRGERATNTRTDAAGASDHAD